jgi:predicted metalloprotease
MIDPFARMIGAGTSGPATLAFAPAPVDPAEPVTMRDVAASNAKVKMAYGALAAMWTSHFDDIGAAFDVPQLLRYRGTVRTGCGVMPQGNAAYCPERNAIYFDEIFIAAMAKQVGGELGTDGDMAAVGVIAHEVGHAVAIQLGYVSRFTYVNEAAADCFAGAFARQSEDDGSLEEGDLEEAFLGMALAGDKRPQPVASSRGDQRRQLRAALMSHGTREQRMQNFRAGLDRGPQACLTHFAVD